MRERESKVEKKAWLHIAIHSQPKKGWKIQKTKLKTDIEGKLFKLGSADFKT